MEPWEIVAGGAVLFGVAAAAVYLSGESGAANRVNRERADAIRAAADAEFRQGLRMIPTQRIQEVLRTMGPVRTDLAARRRASLMTDELVRRGASRLVDRRHGLGH